ncbi:unnamed protein product [Oppiella nova]|uniref:Epoxide hydrolase n=1 Tax=Oppiella nova TaxID=334625 RepID=A0A7R9L9J0_9ACAR|nr:unnamed protein product [Oppiella nova]CAG2160480.1 unnamed protein product [Oppiella nova]
MSSKSNSPAFDEKVPLVARVVVNLLAVFYGFLVSCYLTISIIKNRSSFFQKKRRDVPPDCLKDPAQGFWCHKKRRDVPPDCLKDPALGTHHFIQLKDIKMHYVSKGDENKQLMLFIHGFPEFWYSWRHQMKEFDDFQWEST